MWRCKVCGHTTQDAQRPTICAVCGSEDSFEAFTPPRAADPRTQRHTDTRYASVGVPREQQEVRPSYIEQPNWATVGVTDTRTRERGYVAPEGLVPLSPTPKTGAQDFTLGVMPAFTSNQTHSTVAALQAVAQVENEVEVGRRLRLLALVDTKMEASYVMRSGKKYNLVTGDGTWFADNIPCAAACPAHTDISRYIAFIADEEYANSFELNRESNVFPGCLGRVCARPCESACRRGVIDEPIAICWLKRVASDNRDSTRRERPVPSSGKSVAIIGAGAAGITAARGLARKGHKVTVYDALPVPGGMYWGGVPEWRLPRHIIQDEVNLVADLGVDIRLDTAVGKDVMIADLMANNDAVLIAAGCQVSVGLGIPGEELDGVEYGLTWLEDLHIADWQKTPRIGKHVIVLGLGFTAMDCCRSAVRLGAETVQVLYRRTAAESTVEELELHEAEYEGIEFQWLVTAKRVVGDKNGKVIGLEVTHSELGPLDDSGRPRAIPIKGSEEIIPCDMICAAYGQKPESGFLMGLEMTKLDRRGVPILDDKYMTEIPGLFACGDYVMNPKTFITAIGEGHAAVDAVHEFLTGETAIEQQMEIVELDIDQVRARRGLLSQTGVAKWTEEAMSRRLVWGDDYIDTARQEMPTLPMDLRYDQVAEVELGLTDDEGFEEAKRCLQCQLNIFIDGSKCVLCNGCVDVCPEEVIEMVSLDRINAIDGDSEIVEFAKRQMSPAAAVMMMDEERCIRCGNCVIWCPTDCLTMGHFRMTPDYKMDFLMAEAAGD
ncbi:MAG: FAD-dependent oxidoreductase [Chloroflexota bacterium]|nr:FAD-dependent oxidoreductase [Chloroflexota bacterium]